MVTVTSLPSPVPPKEPEKPRSPRPGLLHARPPARKSSKQKLGSHFVQKKEAPWIIGSDARSPDHARARASKRQDNQRFGCNDGGTSGNPARRTYWIATGSSGCGFHTRSPGHGGSVGASLSRRLRRDLLAQGKAESTLVIPQTQDRMSGRVSWTKTAPVREETQEPERKEPINRL